MGTSVVVGKSTWATPDIAAELLYHSEESELRLRVMAKENLRLVHVGGDKSIFQRFGAGKPVGFTATYIGDGVETPPEMLESIALMNQMERHWKCSLQVLKGATLEVVFSKAPTAPVEDKQATLRLSYERRRFFGLKRDVMGHPLRVDLEQGVAQ